MVWSKKYGIFYFKKLVSMANSICIVMRDCGLIVFSYTEYFVSLVQQLGLLQYTTLLTGLQLVTEIDLLILYD